MQIFHIAWFVVKIVLFVWKRPKINVKDRMAKFLLKVISIKFNSFGPPVHSHFFCFKHTNKFRIEMRQCNKSLWVMQKTKFCKNFIFQENKIDIFSRSRKSTLFKKKNGFPWFFKFGAKMVPLRRVWIREKEGHFPFGKRDSPPEWPAAASKIEIRTQSRNQKSE